MEKNKATMKVFFYIVDDTLVAVDKVISFAPPNIVEITGYRKKLFYKDWEVPEETKDGKTNETKNT